MLSVWGLVSSIQAASTEVLLRHLSCALTALHVLRHRDGKVGGRLRVAEEREDRKAKQSNIYV